MKKLQYIRWMILLLYCFNSAQSTSAQYITLKGRQFYDQTGQPFFPIICNYMANLTWDNSPGGPSGGSGQCPCILANNCTGAEFDLAPPYNEGSTDGFENAFGDGKKYIKADLIKMKQMGFNTVRVFGLQVIPRYDIGDPCTFVFTISKMCHPTPCWDCCGVNPGGSCLSNLDLFKNNSSPGTCPSSWCTKCSTTACISDYDWNFESQSYEAPWLSIHAPYDNTDNIYTNVLLPQINNFLDIANAVGINVILLTADIGQVADNSTHAGYYAHYLAHLAGDLKLRPELLAYDMENEMRWDYRETHLKTEICNYTSQWYDAIKGQDPNHLVTMGNTELGDIFSYDPGEMKLDFNCYHPYITWYWTGYEGYNTTYALERLKAQLYWVNNNCPMPYIIAETNVSAWTPQGADVYATYSATLAPDQSLTTGPTSNMAYDGQDISQPPWQWGSTDYGTSESQAQLASEIQQMLRNYGASGFGWWGFQDYTFSANANYGLVAQVDEGYGDQPGKTPLNAAFYGLLTRGDPTLQTDGSYLYGSPSTLDKPIVGANGAFGSGTHAVTAITAPAAQPIHYYDVWNQGGAYYTITGTVKDQYGNAVKDAVIYGNNFDNSFYTPNPDDFAFNIFTFSADDGSFNLYSPINPALPSLVVPQDAQFTNIQVSAVGASASTTNCQINPITGYNNCPTGYQFILHREGADVGDYDFQLSSITVSSGSSQTFTAQHILTTQDILVDASATADFHAFDEVQLQPDFESVAGSFTTIYCAPVVPDCGATYNITPPHSAQQNNKKENPAINKDIEVHYSFASDIKIAPNPVSDKLYIFSGQDVYTAEVQILNTIGAEVYSGELMLDGKTGIDTYRFSSGFYTVTVKLNDHIDCFKLIINR